MNRYALVTAAGLAIAGMGVVGCDARDNANGTAARTDATPQNPNPNQPGVTARDENAARTAGGTVAPHNADGNDANQATGNVTGPGNTAAAPDAEDIKGMLAASTEAFVKKGTLDDLVERFVDADRNRIGKNDAVLKKADDLDGRADAFLKDWKDKYGKDFDIVDEKVVFNDQMVNVTQGEIGGARTASGSVDADRTANGGVNVNATANNNTGVDRPNDKSADANRNDPGRNIATVNVMASHGLSALTVPLIHEFPDAWKIDVPDSVDANKLKANVLAHLTYLDGNKAQWPADANEAYRLVAHHMLLAVMDKPVTQGGVSQ